MKQVTHASISTQTQDVDTQYTIFDSKSNENIVISISECNDNPLHKKHGRPRKVATGHEL